MFDFLEDEVKLMIDIAIAKNWDLLEIDIEGSDEFIKEAKKQILERVEVQNHKYKEKRVELEITRPVSSLDNLIIANESKIIENEKSNDIDFIKNNLSAKAVLEFSKQKYNINLDEFEVSDDNKINNKTNRQKTRSVIDFFTKEIGIPLKEAIKISNELIKNNHIVEISNISNEEQEKVKLDIVEELSVLNTPITEKSRRKKSDKK